MRIAVIGSGISGNAAAWALSLPEQLTGKNERQVIVYERRERPGGHSHTIDIDYDGTRLPVDIGFIVYNELNYPNLVELFKHLNVETMETSMSFGVSLDNGKLEWAGHSLNGVFAQKRNLFSPSFLGMLRDVFRFNKQAGQDWLTDNLDKVTLGDYLNKHRFSKTFMNQYLAPMGAAIWSTPHADIFNFPARNFIQFFHNHRLIHAKRDRPKWRTVKGGSRNYVEKIIAPFRDNIRYNCEVVAVECANHKVVVTDIHGNQDIFDHVIFASHTDQSLATIINPSPPVSELLGAIQYRANEIYLHRDPALMPKRKRVWSAWNYIEAPLEQQKKNGVCVSYSMNALQNIDEKKPVFVSLNPPRPPRVDLTFHKANFSHPQFDSQAVAAQARLNEIQGVGNLWYCGAWSGYGFHEDGLRSGLEVAERLGARIPWRIYETLNEADTLEPAE